MLRETMTRYGAVRGIPSADPRVTVYRGIPFAAPPTGENRWRAPQPCKPWKGTLDAARFAPISIQDTPGIGDIVYNREWHVDPEIPMDEDCLYLNIWTPAKAKDERLPVLVWYFGGGLQWGYPSEMEFDGERIARRGIVVVSVNYRLNVFGFLAHPELTAEAPDAPTNFGSLDQQAGLKWTYENIAAFGGDPDRITIAGQSAGGGSVLSQLACKESQPMIRGAVVMSAMIRSPYDTGRPFAVPEDLKEAEAAGEAFFDILGVKNLAEARRIDAKEILRAYDVYVVDHPRFFNVEDGHFATGDPMRMLAENRVPDIPVMAGSTTDEFPSMIAADGEEKLAKEARRIFGERAERFLTCPEAHEKAGDGAYAAVNGIELTCETVFRCREKNGGTAKNWCYRFGPEMPGPDRPGVFHSSDLWFFFETLNKCWRPFDGRHFELARQMCDYFCNFIRGGDPNGLDVCGQPLPRWDSENGSVMLFRQAGATPIVPEKTRMRSFLLEETERTLLK